ncbi:MAG: hypothetical protein JWR26_1787 [Pedosphaera sp.]|nr:hypothetical protein [Pedosphaera sp.]
MAKSNESCGQRTGLRRRRPCGLPPCTRPLGREGCVARLALGFAWALGEVKLLRPRRSRSAAARRSSSALRESRVRAGRGALQRKREFQVLAHGHRLGRGVETTRNHSQPLGVFLFFVFARPPMGTFTTDTDEGRGIFNMSKQNRQRGNGLGWRGRVDVCTRRNEAALPSVDTVGHHP